MQLDDLARDLRHALRALRREPAFAAAAVLTFALAIGTSAAMFGLVRRLMLEPPPGVRAPAQVAQVALRYRDANGAAYGGTTTAWPVFLALHAEERAFAGVGASAADSVSVGEGAETSRAASLAVSGDWFATLGAGTVIGRAIVAADDAPPAGAPVVVLGHAYWQRAHGGDPGVLGRQLLVDGTPLTIVGVAARGFNGTGHAPVDLYLPVSIAFAARADGWRSEPMLNLVSVVVRRRAALSAEAASAMALGALREATGERRELTLAAVELESLVPGASARRPARARIAIWLTGVTVVVLLIATANVGTLLLLRAAKRRRETAVRVALGASRGRLVRQLLAESLLLALAGSAVGVLLSRWMSDIVRVTLLPGVAPAEGVADEGVLAASLAAALVAGVLAALAPAVQSARESVADGMRAGGGTGASRRLAFQGALVGVQVALSTVLLVGAGLFVRSLERVQAQDLGITTARLLYVNLSWRAYIPGARRDALHVQAAERTRGIPGVTAATVVQAIPFGPHHVPPIHVPGHAGPPTVGGQRPLLYGATPGFLAMLGVQLREGRLLTARDGRGAPLVVLVNETMARAVWPGESALGKCVQAGHAAEMGDDPDAAAATLPCREVVGVVRDSRARSLRPEGGEAALMQYYVPFEQLPSPPIPDAWSAGGLLVQVEGDPARLAPAVQRAIQGASAEPVYADVRPYDALIEPQLRSWRLGATLFTAFGVLALVIAALGLFGVVSYLVSQRTREMGVRLALGGTGRKVGALVVRDALRLVSVGLGAGTVIAVAAGPLVQPLLFQVSPRDPATVAGAAAVLLLATLAAAAVPAYRASRVSPTTALRADG